MKITEVRVKLLPPSTGGERLRAYATMTLDSEFVIRDLKIIDGAQGLFVAMPSRKLTDRCPNCGEKNHLHARFCNKCGKPVKNGSQARGRTKLFHDVAHPINFAARQKVHDAVVKCFLKELELAKGGDYDYGDGSFFDDAPDENNPDKFGDDEGSGESSAEEGSGS